jgi:hypothetical protein
MEQQHALAEGREAELREARLVQRVPAVVGYTGVSDFGSGAPFATMR